jgi:hypothetical protein
MAGSRIVAPPAAQNMLNHPDVPGPAPGYLPDCTTDGWFTFEALNKLLYYSTTQDVSLQVIAHTPIPHQNQDTILSMAPQGCTALMIHTPGHFVSLETKPR